MEYPGYSAHPASVFRDPGVKNIYRIYRQVNETILPKIRHFFYDKELVTHFSSIDLFPLMVMEKIVHRVENEQTADLGKIIAEIEMFTKDFFGPLIDNIVDAFPKGAFSCMSLYPPESDFPPDPFIHPELKR